MGGWRLGVLKGHLRNLNNFECIPRLSEYFFESNVIQQNILYFLITSQRIGYFLLPKKQEKLKFPFKSGTPSAKFISCGQIKCKITVERKNCYFNRLEIDELTSITFLLN